MADQSEHKRQRVSKACEQCRRKKVKCDGTSPFCNNCSALGLQCRYQETTKKRGPPKGYIEAIEGRLHRLEALLGSVIQEDDPRSQAIMSELNSPLETAYGELVRPRPMRRETLSGYEVECGPLTSSEPIIKSESASGISSPSALSASRQDASDETDNLASVTMDESGQYRYYGKSSGFYMFKTSQNRNLQFNTRPGVRDLTSSPHFPFVVNPFEMPSKDLSDHLLALYFRNFYPLLPIVHKKSFMDAMNDGSKPYPPPILLNAIYAVASRVSSDVRVRTDPDKPETAGDVFFERARLLLDLEWDNFRVHTVQAVLLMSSHQNGQLKTIRGWLYSGMAIRMSQNLGLHRNCDNWDLTPSQKEERKRVFYCCFVLDRLTSSMHGRSPMIDDRDYDTPYPSENDEDDINQSPRILENFHSLIKICEILGDVLRDLYMVKGRKQLSIMPTPDSVISSLDKKLNKWMSKLAPNLQYRPPNTRLNEIAPAPSLELCQLHMCFYTTLILAHRPFIPGPQQKVAPSVFPSASICTFAANKILDITLSLMPDGRLKNVNNYSLFFMFTAGIIFIYNAASSDSMFAFEAKISINKIMRAMDEVESTWPTSARHNNILGVLAGLRDIDLENVDESYTRKRQRQSAAPASIAVLNSPEPEIQEFERIEEKYFMGASTSSNKSNSIDISSPELTALKAQQAQQRNNSMFNENDTSFDPNGTAFFGVPMSFDINEWNSYFSNQKGDAAPTFASSPQHYDTTISPPLNHGKSTSSPTTQQSITQPIPLWAD